MKLKKALKEKNKLVGKLNEDLMKLQTYNSVEENSERAYDPRESLESVIETVSQIVELKTSIHRANAKVYDKIFRLAELKSLVKNIKNLDCTSGKRSPQWGSESPVVKTTVITVLERDALVKEIEGQIEVIQEMLDEHNSKTSI
jgi:hypothetical protein